MGEQTHPQPLDSANASDLVMYVATRLGETDQRPLRQIRRFAEALGREGLLDVLEESIRVDEAGGLYLEDGRRRSLGGVFFYFAKLRLGLATGASERDRDADPADASARRGDDAAEPPTGEQTREPGTGDTPGPLGGSSPGRKPGPGANQLDLFGRSDTGESLGTPERVAARRPQRSGPEIVIRRRVIGDLERPPEPDATKSARTQQDAAGSPGTPEPPTTSSQAAETRPRRRIILLSPPPSEPEQQPDVDVAGERRGRSEPARPRERGLSSGELRRRQRTRPQPGPDVWPRRPPEAVDEPEPEPAPDPAAIQREAEAAMLARVERPARELIQQLADRLHELVLKGVIGELGSLTAIGSVGLALRRTPRRPMPRRARVEPAAARSSSRSGPRRPARRT